MSSEAKQLFLDYIKHLDMSKYSQSILTAVKIALNEPESAFTTIPNWWPDLPSKRISNEALARFIQESTADDVDDDAEQISVTVDGVPKPNYSTQARIKILSECLNNTIEAWKKDPNGMKPVITKAQSRKAVIAYPLSGSNGKKIAEWIGTPPSYPEQQIPRWQRMKISKSPELVVTITNAGHLTNAHIDNPGLQSDVYHIFGRKLWFLWDDCDENTEKMKNRSGHYNEIDLEWCCLNLVKLKVCRSISFSPMRNNVTHPFS